jgi:DNA-binding transcriptional regulator YhcF (GntR family)
MLSNHYNNTPPSLTAQLHALSDLEQTIIRHVTYYASKAWGYCQKTYKTISDETGISVATVERVMRLLKSLNLASIRRMGRLPSRITVAESLKAWVSQRFCSREGTVRERKPLSIYKSKIDDGLNEVLVKEATKEEAETIIERMSKSGVTESSISNVRKYVTTCVNNLRNGTHKLLKHLGAPKIINVPPQDVERIRESITELLESCKKYGLSPKKELSDYITSLGSKAESLDLKETLEGFLTKV